MRADFIRNYKSVHTWAGILSGLALFIAFYAGALTVFKEPLRRWATAPAAVLQPVPLDAVQPLITQTLATQPAALRGVAMRLENGQAIPRLEWKIRDPHADDHDERSTRHYAATLTADGSVHVREEQPAQLVEFIDVLHRVVGLPADIDPYRWFMGVVAILYGVALVSGVVVLLPTLVKDFFALRIGKNKKRMWLDAHNVVGIISLPFHIVMALSSVVFAYHDQIYAVQDKLIHQGQWAQPAASAPSAPGTTNPLSPAARNPADMLSPAELVRIVQEMAPGFEPNGLQYAQVTGPRPIVRVWGKDPQGISPRAVGGFAALDPYSGKLLSKDYLSGQQSTPNLFISSFFALHMASFGGTAVTWLYFLLGLAGAWLFYSGNLLWVEARRKVQRKNSAMPTQRRDTSVLAGLTVGVCMGCVAGISLTMAAAKWLPGRVEDMATWHIGIYYAVFFASVIWALWRSAARAAAPLLWFAAGCTLMIPLSTLLGWLLPGTGAWADSATLAVDVTALVGGLALAWMAKATARRTRHGPADSVWAVPQPST